MKVLLIGGTGNISNAISKLLLAQGHELWLLNRGSNALPEGAHLLQADIHCEQAAAALLAGHTFDAVADFIAYTPEDLERDWRLFSGRTKQFVYISTASGYQKPLSNYVVTESTPMYNPYWTYSQLKIDGEDLLMRHYRQDGFPITIVRPSHTYSERKIPLALNGDKGSFPVIRRMLAGKPVVIPGDGTSLWTLTHSNDFAKAFVGLLGNPHAIGEAVHITGDEVLTWNQVYQIVADALGVPLHAVHVPSDLLEKTNPFSNQGGLWGDKANCAVFDTAKIKRLVPGFTATIRFDQGVQEAIAYAMAHPELQTEEPLLDAWFDSVIAAQNAALEAVQKAMQP